MRRSLEVCDIGMSRMREALHPGITENALWAELHHANIAHGGEWIETRLLSSGPRTNPWLQECSDRRINRGVLEVVAEAAADLLSRAFRIERGAVAPV